MKLSNLIKWFLRFLQISAFFPYFWKKLKIKNINNEDKKIALSETSLIYEFEINSDIPIKFIYDKCIARISTLWLSFMCFLGIYISYGNIYIESGDASTYKYCVPIFSGLIYASFIITLIHLKLKSKIFLKIIINVISTLSENYSLKNIYNSWWFFRILFSIILFFVHFILQLFHIFNLNYNSKTFLFYFSETFYYAYKAFINMTVVLILDLICFLYSFGYNIEHLQKNNLESKIFCVKTNKNRAIVLYNFNTNELIRLETELEEIIAKFHLMNKYQKIMNSFFGILISSILIQIITHMIWGLYLFATNIPDKNFFVIFIMMVKVSDFSNKVFNIFTSSEIINEKVYMVFI